MVVVVFVVLAVVGVVVVVIVLTVVAVVVVVVAAVVLRSSAVEVPGEFVAPSFHFPSWTRSTLGGHGYPGAGSREVCVSVSIFGRFS